MDKLISPEVCSICSGLNRHAADCKTMLNTREKRVGYVAWKWNTQYTYDYSSLGISADEVADGNTLGKARVEEWIGNRLTYGDPAYGSWPEGVKHPIEDCIRQMCGWPPRTR